MVKDLPASAGGREDPLEKEMATHPAFLPEKYLEASLTGEVFRKLEPGLSYTDTLNSRGIFFIERTCDECAKKSVQPRVSI